MAISLLLTRGREKTFPVLTLDGESIGDSTAIIAALERRYPEPPLYPEDPAERDRALALEDFFDEELGPHSRLLAFHHMIDEPEARAEFSRQPSSRPRWRTTRRCARWPAGGRACSRMRATG